MTKIVKLLVLILVFFVFSALLVSPSAMAGYREQVLAAETSNVQIPPTTDGPGLILPDSPLFFLDNFKQNVRLFLAFTPEEKAKVHAQIAGERLAELRFMLVKGNQEGIRTALLGVSDNLSKSADNLETAKLSGKDVSKLAVEINQNIKNKQQNFDLLKVQGNGNIAALANAALQSLFEAKVRVEDSLPADQLENEIRNDLNRRAQERIVEASASAKELEADLDELNSQASEAARRSLKVREEALQKAIAQKDEALKRVEQNLLNIEKQKQEEFLKAQNEASFQAKDAIEKARAAALKFQNSQKVLNEIRSQNSQSTSAIPAIPKVE